MKGLTEKQKVILSKVEKIETRNYYIERCVTVKICPECGKDLILKHNNTDNLWKHDCWECGCGYKILL